MELRKAGLGQSEPSPSFLFMGIVLRLMHRFQKYHARGIVIADLPARTLDLVLPPVSGIDQGEEEGWITWNML
jgi:hypothetical protein